jgi:hypothetical protein
MNPFSRIGGGSSKQNIQLSSSPVKLVTASSSTSTRPSLSKKANQSTSSGRLTVEDRIKKNRKIINSFLKHVGTKVGKDLKLGAKGIEYFQYKQFFIAIEVPEDESDSVFIYTMVFRLTDNHDRFAVLEACMQLNYMTQATRGSTLGLNGDEVNLCYSTKVNGLNREAFVETLEDFMMTMSDANRQLGLATCK